MSSRDRSTPRKTPTKARRSERAAPPRTWPQHLRPYLRIYREIGGQQFIFLVEETRSDASYACTLDDVARMLSFIPWADYGTLSYVIFRQPSRKEETRRRRWGEYLASFRGQGGEWGGALVLPAVTERWTQLDASASLRSACDLLGRHISLDLRALRRIDLARALQLYLYLPFLIAQHVHFLVHVLRPLQAREGAEDVRPDGPAAQVPELLRPYDRIPLNRQRLNNASAGWGDPLRREYDERPEHERLTFAQRYVQDLLDRVGATGALPFDRIHDDWALRCGLHLGDFAR